ncbi:Glyoxylase, beta-lactamase superfamily II [Halogranum gelatinilyticum]|uniref:Glyoxylase, beta-lactamase superfamily II n=1 Tax=Halogranum gelatinilyticum TaxID=660521 RepID=A0A1G9SJA0_9EURY|nr:MBL fold metallo-hydrolase [Halogranum gelatinilyticum]SDM35578.1 Glyoxylase, beta-lactamase superfamily II [Halogranum gelatinilyticum]
MIHNIAQGVQAFTSNAFLVAGDRTVLVDTGANFDAVSHLQGDVDNLDAIVLTHTHPDHVGNVDAVRDAFDVDVWGFDASHPMVDHAIADDEEVEIGSRSYRALHTPGHKNDHLCFLSSDGEVLFAGDLVFQNGGFGRTDLEEGNRDLLVESIDRVLATADESLGELHVGHGPSVVDQPYRHIEQAAQAARLY